MSLAWLADIPGARAAYDYVAGRLVAFEESGIALRRQLAELDAWWHNDFPPPPHSAALLAFVNEWAVIRNTILARLDRWTTIDAALRPIWQAVQDVNAGRTPTTLPANNPPVTGGVAGAPASTALGVIIPWPLIVKVGGWLIGLAYTLHEFFSYMRGYDRTIKAFLDEGVANGTMTPQQAVEEARRAQQAAAEEPTILSEVSGIVKVLALGALAFMALQYVQSQPRRSS